jgi:hypothetical protein
MLGFVFLEGWTHWKIADLIPAGRHLWWSGEAAMTSRTSPADVLGSKVP